MKVNKMEVSQNTEESDEDNRRIIKKDIQIQYDLGSSSKKKTKTCSEEQLTLKLEKSINLRIICSITKFEGIKKIIKNTVSKIIKINPVRNED